MKTLILLTFVFGLTAASNPWIFRQLQSGSKTAVRCASEGIGIVCPRNAAGNGCDWGLGYTYTGSTPTANLNDGDNIDADITLGNGEHASICGVGASWNNYCTELGCYSAGPATSSNHWYKYTINSGTQMALVRCGSEPDTIECLSNSDSSGCVWSGFDQNGDPVNAGLAERSVNGDVSSIVNAAPGGQITTILASAGGWRKGSGCPSWGFDEGDACMDLNCAAACTAETGGCGVFHRRGACADNQCTCNFPWFGPQCEHQHTSC